MRALNLTQEERLQSWIVDYDVNRFVVFREDDKKMDSPLSGIVGADRLNEYLKLNGMVNATFTRLAREKRSCSV